MDDKEKQEHIHLITKIYSNTFWPLTGSKYLYFDASKDAEEITIKGRNFLKETVVYGMV